MSSIDEIIEFLEREHKMHGGLKWWDNESTRDYLSRLLNKRKVLILIASNGKIITPEEQKKNQERIRKENNDKIKRTIKKR